MQALCVELELSEGEGRNWLCSSDLEHLPSLNLGMKLHFCHHHTISPTASEDLQFTPSTGPGTGVDVGTSQKAGSIQSLCTSSGMRNENRESPRG